MAAKSNAKAKKQPQRLPLAEPVLRPSFRHERRAFARGIFPVAGCDEAGRGPLAGPVVAAAVILDPDRIPRGVNDSTPRRARNFTRKSAPARRSRSPSAQSNASTATTSCAPRCGRWRAR
jgi:hypothetical protein